MNEKFLPSLLVRYPKLAEFIRDEKDMKLVTRILAAVPGPTWEAFATAIGHVVDQRMRVLRPLPKIVQDSMGSPSCISSLKNIK